MNLSQLKRRSEFTWSIEPTGRMRVPVIIYGNEQLVSGEFTGSWEFAGFQYLTALIDFATPDRHRLQDFEEQASTRKQSWSWRSRARS
jgi:hypothetical protein